MDEGYYQEPDLNSAKKLLFQILLSLAICLWFNLFGF